MRKLSVVPSSGVDVVKAGELGEFPPWNVGAPEQLVPLKFLVRISWQGRDSRSRGGASISLSDVGHAAHGFLFEGVQGGRYGAVCDGLKVA